MDSVRQIWQDLRLDELVSDRLGAERDLLPLKAQATLASSKQSATKILLGHKKTWKRPSHAVLKERYGSLPHDPPVLDPSKLVRLADPLRGRFSSFDKLMSEDEDEGDEEGHRYKRAFASPSSSSYNNNKNRSSQSPAKASDAARSSAFFLTAAGSDDDDANESFNPRRVAGGSAFAASQGVSRVRGKLDEARRLGAVKERLSKPVLGRRAPAAGGAAGAVGGLQRQKSGRFPPATQLNGKASGVRKYSNVKTSIPPQQPPPKRKAREAPFGVRIPANNSGGGSGAQGKARRGVPGAGPVGLGLDTSNVSSNIHASDRERTAAKRRNAVRAVSGAIRSQCTMDVASGGGASAARIQCSRALTGLTGVKSAPAALARQGSSLQRVDEGRPGTRMVGSLGRSARAAGSTAAAVPVSGVSDRGRGGAAGPSGYGSSGGGGGGGGGSSSMSAVRRKSVTIDPSLSPTKAGSAGAGTAGMWRSVARARREDAAPSGSLSPRAKGATAAAASTSSPRSSPRGTTPSLTAPVPPGPAVDVQATLTTLDRIRAKDAERAQQSLRDAPAPIPSTLRAPQGRAGPGARLGVPLPESSAALLAQHARRLSSHLSQARSLASQYDVEANNPDPFSSKRSGASDVDVSAFLPTRRRAEGEGKICI